MKVVEGSPALGHQSGGAYKTELSKRKKRAFPLSSPHLRPRHRTGHTGDYIASQGHDPAPTRPWSREVQPTPYVDLGLLTLWGAC